MAPTYPFAIKVFTTYHDYTDIIFANSVNEIEDEVASIETILGTNPVSVAPTYVTSVGGAIQDLYNTKAPKAHLHSHTGLPDDATGDDHLQYSRVDGTRPFTGPVSGQWAANGSQLVPLSQLQSQGYISLADANWLILQRLTNLTTGALGGTPLLGPAASAPNWVITGGLYQQCTDGSGRITHNFGNAFGTMVQAYVATKIPVGSGNACPPYNYVEAQLTLVGITLNSATVQFSHDYSWQPHLWVAYSWMAIGL